MDSRRLRYSPHARAKMMKRDISEDEVEGITAYPLSRSVTSRGVEHVSFSDDGRVITVVTDHTETFVITVIEQERRQRQRRKRR